MIQPSDFGIHLKSNGFTFFSGVPCSFLTPLINYAINDLTYVGAANEGDAVAIAAGAALTGQQACVLFQNSGLGNAVSPLTSLIQTFKIPILGFVTLRGEPGLKDEPQHELMGQITEKMLDLMGIDWAYLSDDITEVPQQLALAKSFIDQHKPYFFVVRKNTFASITLHDQRPLAHIPADIQNSHHSDERPTRLAVLDVLSRMKTSQTVMLATTGKTGRELCCGVSDSPQHLYMVGSMGCISSLGLGVSLSKTDTPTIVIDGDGALLMRMGNLATLGAYRPNNLLHVVLDNTTHDSTGGQSTVSDALNIPLLAQAANYPRIIHAHSIHELEQAVFDWNNHSELTMIYLKISLGSTPNIGRPSISPPEVKARLMEFLRA